jgi:hypothetical protein
MVNKSRKKNKQKGGAVHKLPPNVAPTTGAKVKDLIENFYKNNNLYYIDAHGALLDSTYTVPENTYILHAGVSGKSVNSAFCSTEGKFLGKDNDLMDLVQKDNRDDLWKLLTGQENASATSMFSPAKINIEKDTLAIYEPGDVVHDMKFVFSSEGDANLAISMIGIYKIPVREYLFTQMEDSEKNKTKKLTNYRNSTAGKAAPLEEKEKKETELGSTVAKVSDTYFRTHPDNLLKDYFTRPLAKDKESLRHILTESGMVTDEELFPFPEGGVRIFIVNACRFPYIASSPEDRLQKAKAMRRKSLTLRKYNEGVKEAYERAQVEEEATAKPIWLIKEAQNFLNQHKKNLNKKARNTRKAKREITFTKLNTYLHNNDESVLNNLKEMLLEEERKQLQTFNKAQKNEKKAMYSEILKKLKLKLIRENIDDQLL